MLRISRGTFAGRRKKGAFAGTGTSTFFFTGLETVYMVGGTGRLPRPDVSYPEVYMRMFLPRTILQSQHDMSPRCFWSEPSRYRACGKSPGSSHFPAPY